MSYYGVWGFIFVFHTLQAVQIESLRGLFLLRSDCPARYNVTYGDMYYDSKSWIVDILRRRRPGTCSKLCHVWKPQYAQSVVMEIVVKVAVVEMVLVVEDEEEEEEEEDEEEEEEEEEEE